MGSGQQRSGKYGRREYRSRGEYNWAQPCLAAGLTPCVSPPLARGGRGGRVNLFTQHSIAMAVSNEFFLNLLFPDNNPKLQPLRAVARISVSASNSVGQTNRYPVPWARKTSPCPHQSSRPPRISKSTTRITSSAAGPHGDSGSSSPSAASSAAYAATAPSSCISSGSASSSPPPSCSESAGCNG